MKNGSRLRILVGKKKEIEEEKIWEGKGFWEAAWEREEYIFEMEWRGFQ